MSSTRKIPRSSIPEGFDLDQAIAGYVDELKAWSEHNGRCVAEAKRRENTDPAPTEPAEHQFYPAPVAHPLVRQALDISQNGDGTVSIVKDYEIEEDGPTPAEQLEAKLQALHGRVATMEQAAGEAVMPIAKRRHIEFMASDAEAVLEEKRTDAQKAAIKARDDMKLALEVVARHGAKLQSNVADLAAEDIEGWTPEEFPR